MSFGYHGKVKWYNSGMKRQTAGGAANELRMFA